VNSNRTKGHAYECLLAARWRGLGFPDAATSRYVSRQLDDAGVDIANTNPYLIQAKAYKSAPPIHAIIDELEKKFPGQVPLVYWKRPRVGEVVTLRASDFEEMINSAKL
jgi:hypothetical protein